jgi:hypothetical protein
MRYCSVVGAVHTFQLWRLYCSAVGFVLFNRWCCTVPSWVHHCSAVGASVQSWLLHVQYCAIMGAVHCSLVDGHTAQSRVLSFCFADVVFLLFTHGNCAVQCRVLCCSVSGAVLFSVGCCAVQCRVLYWMFHRMGIRSAIHLWCCWSSITAGCSTLNIRTNSSLVMYVKLGHDAAFLNHGRSSTASLFKWCNCITSNPTTGWWQKRPSCLTYTYVHYV